MGNQDTMLAIERDFLAGWMLFRIGATLDSETCIARTELGEGRAREERISFEARDGFEAAQKFGLEAATMGQAKESARLYLDEKVQDQLFSYDVYTR